MELYDESIFVNTAYNLYLLGRLLFQAVDVMLGNIENKSRS